MEPESVVYCYCRSVLLSVVIWCQLSLENQALLKPLHSVFQARKRHININVLIRLRLGRLPVWPWDKPRLSQGQTQVVSGTNRGFLLILHSGSLVCPWDKPGLSLGQTRWRMAAEKVYVPNVYVPFLAPSFAIAAVNLVSVLNVFSVIY